MEEENIENIDSQNDGVQEVDAKEEKIEYTEREKSLYAQLQKAKGKVQDENGKWVAKPHTESKTESKAKSDDLDYGQKAFLIASGIKGEAETKFVKEMMKESGKSLDQVLESKYFQSELETMRELAKTANATPTGRRSGNSAVDSVEYWMQKPMEDIPKEMRIKVINARLDKERGKGVFYDS